MAFGIAIILLFLFGLAAATVIGLGFSLSCDRKLMGVGVVFACVSGSFAAIICIDIVLELGWGVFAAIGRNLGTTVLWLAPVISGFVSLWMFNTHRPPPQEHTPTGFDVLPPSDSASGGRR